MGKKDRLIRHSHKRLRERFGISLSNEELRELGEQIRKKDEARFKGKAVFFDTQSLRVTRWFVWFRDRWIPIVYDKNRKVIITALPEGSFGPVPSPPS